MKYNFHMHSCYSDGTDTPEELIRLAKEEDVNSVALTDHDTVEGVDSFISATKGTNIKAITGVEITTSIGLKNIHMLAYGIDINNKELLNFLNVLTVRNTMHTKYIFENYVSSGYDYTWEQVLHHNPNRKGIFIVNAFNAMLKDRLFSSWKEFTPFVRKYFLVEDKTYCPPVEQCINIIKQSGGKAFLAHPKIINLGMNEEVKIILKLKSMGLDGMEVYYPAHSLKEVKWYEQCCEKYNLEISGGTDWHGKARKTTMYFNGNIEIKTNKE